MYSEHHWESSSEETGAEFAPKQSGGARAPLITRPGRRPGTKRGRPISRASSQRSRSLPHSTRTASRKRLRRRVRPPSSSSSSSSSGSPDNSPGSSGTSDSSESKAPSPSRGGRRGGRSASAPHHSVSDKNALAVGKKILGNFRRHQKKMATEEEEKKARIAECTKTIAGEISILLKNTGNTSFVEADISVLATVLAEQGNRCLAHVANQGENTALRAAVDSANDGAVSSLLRLIWTESRAKGRMTYKQDCKELLKKIPYLAIMADREFPHLMPDPEALDILCSEGKNASTQNAFNPLPNVDFITKPWFPYTDTLAHQMQSHFDHLKASKKVENESEFYLRYTHWVHVTLRHIITADASGLLKPYGGIIPQLERVARLTHFCMQYGEEHVYALDAEERSALAKKAERRDSVSQIIEFIVSGNDKTTKEVEKLVEERRKNRKNPRAGKRQRPNTRGSNEGGGARNRDRRGTLSFYYEPECRTPLSPRMSMGKVVSFDPFVKVISYR